MNGHPRDQIDTDLASGRPTLSPTLDRLVALVVSLQSGTESRDLFADLEQEVRRSASFHEWIGAPTRYLSDFDVATTLRLEERLQALHAELRQRARERGWEIDSKDSPT